MKFNPDWVTPAAERDREPTEADRLEAKRERQRWRKRYAKARAKVITLVDVYHTVAPDMALDVEALQNPEITCAPETLIINMRWYARRMVVFVELEKLLGPGKVRKGDHDDAMAIIDHCGGKPSEAARRVAAGDLREWPRDPYTLHLMIPDEDGA